MNHLRTYDAIIVGGGPAGSTCAAVLVKNGVHTLLLDRVRFPRVKLCAGWLSAPVWDVLGITPKEYPRGLWEWNKAHIHFHGKKYTIKSHGYFIRRYEFDNFLLRRSQVERIEDHLVREIERDNDDGYWVIDKQFRAKYLIGAGGSHCPVARACFPKSENLQCGTQEREFEGNPEEIAACRAGKDGEPEILLRDNMKGYSWNVPKGRWLNIGSGTKEAREVRAAWSEARAFFEGQGVNGTIPLSSRPMLDKMKGHGYTIFASEHLRSCQRDNAFLIGDALGLAQPMTGEGILPAILSGKLCADAIVEGLPETYEDRLSTHPVIKNYRMLYGIQTRVQKIFRKKNTGDQRYRKSWLRDRIVVYVFAYLFSGKSFPGSGFVGRMRK